jgi:hypothetical protein
MPSTVHFSRAHLIYGLCLPLALIIGYLMADPLDSATMAVVVLVISVLSIPIFMRWHHALLIFSVNAVMMFNFLPGRPPFWMLMTFVSVAFTLLNTSIGQSTRFFQARRVAFSLICLGVIVVLTGQANGGIKFAVLGGENYGGKKYFSVLASILMYFAISNVHISPGRARWYVALYFLASLTSLVGFLVVLGGPAFLPLVEIFPIEGTLSESASYGDAFAAQIPRVGELTTVTVCLCCLLLACYGLKGVLDLKRPWRLFLMALAVIGALASGYRSNFAIVALTSLVVFVVERLYRTRLVIGLIGATVLALAIIIPNAHNLPLGMQRTLSFLPLDIDPLASVSAETSTNWRLDMWKLAVQQVPKHLLVGKGYALDPDELYLLAVSANSGFSQSDELSMLAGDYHSGPLSVILPFGIFGVVCFVWFLIESLKVLRRNMRFGGPELANINTLLYCYFIVRILTFIFVFGSLYSDIATFASIVALSLSLNRGVREQATAEPEEAFDGLEFNQI